MEKIEGENELLQKLWYERYFIVIYFFISPGCKYLGIYL